ncbi:MAG: peptidylprolyl isomerase [Lysobacterales bacterium 14-68-21]|nr:MAG: peptidylprolyl isomerase [Xanthomonadales bacterium 14-68-21]
MRTAIQPTPAHRRHGRVSWADSRRARSTLKAFLLSLLLIAPSALLAQKAPKDAANAPSPVATPEAPRPEVVLHTTLGDITLELYPDKSPKSVANFLQYVHDGFYAGTVFHRVIPGYLVQGGLYTRDLQPRRTRPAIASEADNGLSNIRGTIAVARGADPNSGTSQFFFNLVDNRRLDFVGSQSGLTWGYAVFGKVIKGITRAQGPFAGDVPNPLVVITGAEVVGEATKADGTQPASAATAPPPPKAAKSKSKAGPASAEHHG